MGRTSRLPKAFGSAITPFAIAWIALSGCAATAPPIGETTGPSSDGYAVVASVNFAEPIEVPCRIRLGDATKQRIMVEVPGYHPFQVHVRRTPAGWRSDRINFGDHGAVAVDLLIGGVYMLTEQQYAEASRLQPGFPETRPGYLHVVAAPEPNSEWRKIASLQQGAGDVR